MKFKLIQPTLQLTLVRVLRLLNLILEEERTLTETEIIFLSRTVALPAKYRYYRFATPAKKRLQKQYQEDGRECTLASLNNKIYSLLKKNILWKDEDNVVYFDKSIDKVLDMVVANWNGGFRTEIIMEVYGNSKS